jgi:hypothetical protein
MNKYERIADEHGVEAGFAQIESDARFIIQGACNPTAIANTLRDAVAFYCRQGDGSDTVGRRAAVQIILTQLTHVLVGKNVASNAAWDWCFDDDEDEEEEEERADDKRAS